MPDLGGIRPIAHDPDERPTREDRAYGGSIFDIPVPLPRFLRRRRRSAPAADVADRAKRARQENAVRAARHGNVAGGDPGPFGG